MPIPEAYTKKPYLGIAAERAKASTDIPPELQRYADDAEILLAARIVREMAGLKHGQPFTISAAKLGLLLGKGDFGGRWVLDLFVTDGVISRGRRSMYGFEYTYLHSLPSTKSC